MGIYSALGRIEGLKPPPNVAECTWRDCDSRSRIHDLVEECLAGDRGTSCINDWLTKRGNTGDIPTIFYSLHSVTAPTPAGSYAPMSAKVKYSTQGH